MSGALEGVTGKEQGMPHQVVAHCNLPTRAFQIALCVISIQELDSSPKIIYIQYFYLLN